VPRSGWIAVGAIGAALLLGADDRQSIVLALVAGAVMLAAWSARTLGGSARVSGGRSAASWTAKTALIALGVLAIAVRLMAAPLATPTAVSGPLPTGGGPWTGSVVTISSPRAGAQPTVVELDPPIGLLIAATLPVYPLVVPGDRVTLRGSLRAPPADDPYGAYLVRIGVAATLRAASLTLEPPPDDVGRSLEGLRRSADEALQLAIPEPEAGLASGILIGLRDRVDRDLTGAFTAVGATHVVAISGWNIAIVASMLAAFAGRLARRRRMILTALAIVGYVAFVGPSPSVVRAAGMAGVVMLARELGRPSRAAAAIGWAVAGLLIVDPRLVDDVGFRLSALATVGLIAWGTPLADRLSGATPGRVRGWLAESLGVSLAAQLATLPIVVLTFGRLSLVSPVVNLGVVPLVAPAMAAGTLALAGGILALAGLPSAIATILGLPAWLLFSVIVGIVRAGAAVPFASVQLASPWDAVAAGISGLTIIAATAWARRRAGGARTAGTRAAPPIAVTRRTPPPWWRSRMGRLLAGGLAASMIAIGVVAVHRPDGIPRVIVLDVGQGDAILVEGGRGGRLLVDGGPDPGRLLVALDEHLPPWDRRIDVIVLSHPHEDHAAGLVTLLDRYAVSRVLEPGMFGPGPGYAALNAELFDRGIARGTLATGDRLAVDDIRFRVLWPDPGTVPERPADTGTGINNVSIVLLGEVGRHRMLLAGDIEEQIDPRLLARGLPTVDLLKVAHHGSRTSSTDALLAAVQPAVAVISSGRGNPYGHPTPATMERLRATGAEVFRTDEDGSVTVDLGPGPLRVRASGARAATGPTGPGAATAFLCGLPGPDRTRTASGPEIRGVPVAPVAATPVAQPDSPIRLGYDARRDQPDSGRSALPAAVHEPPPPGRHLVRRRRTGNPGARHR